MTLLDKIKRNATAFKLCLLICLLGTASWVEINGIWVELPLLVSKSPQKWSLPSYLTVAIQLANIGPILYFIGNKYVKRNGEKIVTEIPAIYCILIVGILASFLLAFLWDKTTIIEGRLYSTALIVLSFFLATVDCTSSLTFLPFMAHFPTQYMTAYYIGEGFSGFLPSILALIQGVGKQSYYCKEKTTLKNITVTSSRIFISKNVTETAPEYFSTEPRFSVRIFFLFVSFMMCLSLASFAWLIRINKRVKVSEEDKTSDETDAFNLKNLSIDRRDTFKTNLKTVGEHSKGGACSDNHSTVVTSSNDQSDIKTENTTKECFVSKTIISNYRVVLLLFILNGLINGLSNGVLPALQSYACLPYSFNIYHLTLVLSAFANPLSCFLYFFISLESTFGIFIGVIIYIVSAGYTIGVAAMSPCPVMNDSVAGGYLILVVTVFGVGLVSYLKTAISSVMRKDGQQRLFWCGVSVQIGSLIGAIAIFPLVNVYGVFKQSEPCQVCRT